MNYPAIRAFDRVLQPYYEKLIHLQDAEDDELTQWYIKKYRDAIRLVANRFDMTYFELDRQIFDAHNEWVERYIDNEVARERAPI